MLSGITPFCFISGWLAVGTFAALIFVQSVKDCKARTVESLRVQSGVLPCQGADRSQESEVPPVEEVVQIEARQSGVP